LEVLLTNGRALDAASGIAGLEYNSCSAVLPLEGGDSGRSLSTGRKVW
jgi:hypothetical protein